MADDDFLPPTSAGVPAGRLLTSLRFSSEDVATLVAQVGLPTPPVDDGPEVPTHSGAPPALRTAETYWKPFRYSPEIDEALCFACETWLAPDAFDLDAHGVPEVTCRTCRA